VNCLPAIEAKLKEVYKAEFPRHQVNHWHPSEGEFLICVYYDAELAQRDDQIGALTRQVDELSLRLSRFMSGKECP
jgi:pyrroloquinoline quinone (PQQ) biosynthesis protein C